MQSIKLKQALVIGVLLVVNLQTQGADLGEEHKDVVVSGSRAFEEQGGEAIFYSVCQGCHMGNGQGAKGAAQYPALANNPKLAGAPYPIYMVLKGQGAMPSFGAAMSDQQVADVVNYVRSHFGNHYSDMVGESDIKNMR
jgi:mono/diheme cytochrome c family protein